MPKDRKVVAHRGRQGLLAATALAVCLAGGMVGTGFVPSAEAAESAAKPVAKPAAKPAANNPLGGFATDPNEPIEIEADSLEVEDKRQMATFIGNVLAVQGETKLRSDRLQANYAPNANGERTQVREIYATGKVHVLSKDDQSADGDWARYVVADRTIVMGDNVVLRQGKNVIRGKKLFIDLNTGRSRVAGSAEAGTTKPGATGRVKALFQPSNEPKK
ncbi:MAG: lipopolysaccharide transport periplasmic protein LptA [Parvibaculum sp.]|uniref:lipopolysaccharide transport periplasmic protein LptA n=1 Tax=Parvibaculum sp. TaxID=2024848 RepID=UPI003C780ED0